MQFKKKKKACLEKKALSQENRISVCSGNRRNISMVTCQYPGQGTWSVPKK